MQNQRRTARELALNLLYQVDAAGLTLDDAVQAARENVTADDAVFEYAEKLVYGVSKNRREIDRTIRGLSKDWPIARQPAVDRNILRIALQELSLADPATPVAVIVNEAVEMAKKFSTEDSGKFVNGILGAYLKANKTEEEV